LRAEAPGGGNQNFSLYVTASNSLRSTPSLFVQGSSGNVGIGTTDPLASLHVSSSSGLMSILNSSNTNGGYISFRRVGAEYGYIGNAAQVVTGGLNTDIAIAGVTNIEFSTGGSLSERMRITSGGNVGIGTSSPSTKLHVEGTVLCSSSNWINTNIQIRRRGSVDGIEVTGDGTNGVFLLYGSNSWGSMSDERLKDINSLITDAVPSVMSLRAVKYNWKSDATKQSRVGLIAQDIQAVLPEAVDVNNDEMKTISVKYTEVIPLLVAAIQELSADLTSAKQEIELLKAK
jgi:hypothetical protein